jgi:hypothetical protein
MRYLRYGLFSIAAWLMASAVSAQGVTVQGLNPASSPLSGADVFWCGQGTHTYKCTTAQIGGYPISIPNTWAGGKQTFAPAATGYASINLAPGVAPSSPISGDMWCTTAACYIRSGSTSVAIEDSLTGPGSATVGHLVTWDTYPNVADGGAVPSVVAGSGITVTGSPAYTVRITTNGVTNALAAQMAANTIKGNFTGSTANAADNAMPSCSASGSALLYTSGTGFSCGSGYGLLAVNNVWTASQRVTKSTITISTATFTPNFDTGADFEIGLTSACPCTLANPSTTPVAGQHGVIYVTQDGTGSRTIGTWGSQYLSAGGTSTITLSTTASAIDVFSYVVKDATHIVLSLGAANVSH